MNTTIKLKIIDENIEFTSSPPVYSGDVNTVSTLFEFGVNWDNFTKTAVFYRDINNPYTVILKDDECLIPPEVMVEKGRIYIGVFGVLDNKVKTSEVVYYDIGTGIMTHGAIPEPSEDIWQQILRNIEELKRDMSKIHVVEKDNKKEKMDLSFVVTDTFKFDNEGIKVSPNMGLKLME